MFPSLLSIVGSYQYSEGQTIHLHCRVKVFPPPDAIVWEVRDFSNSNSRVLHPTSRVSISSTHLFINNGEPYSSSDVYIRNVIGSDSGNYMCVIFANKLGVVQMTTQNINVSCKLS